MIDVSIIIAHLLNVENISDKPLKSRIETKRIKNIELSLVMMVT